MPYAIGIDLGTTNSCVAVMINDKVEVIINEFGSPTTPSYVAFNDVEVSVGNIAKDLMSQNIKNTVYGAKRLIGRRFDDPVVQHDMKNWPFQVICDDDNLPAIRVKLHGQKVDVTPERISAEVLRHMKQIAERHLGEVVLNAVITVPAHFNHAQRQATLDAAHVADLNVLNMINEPTAAALTYAHKYPQRFQEEFNFLVYDFGGGTFDVTIVHNTKTEMRVLATSGDTNLGGDNFDCELLEYCVQWISDERNVKIRSNRRALRRLHLLCEKAKRELSFCTSTNITVDFLDRAFAIKITREKFVKLNRARFEKSLLPVEQALADANLSKTSVKHVVLVGGSSYIPHVRKILEEFFGDKLDFSINPDQAVAYGAALHAASFGSHANMFVKRWKDVVSLSIGYDLIAQNSNEMITKIVIKRNTPIPARGASISYNTEDNQKTRQFKIRQGESVEPSMNYLLGEFFIENLPPGPAESIEIRTVFNVDCNGILHVHARETSTGKSNSITVVNVVDRKRNERLKRIIDSAAVQAIETEHRRKANNARSELMDECKRIRRAAGNRGGHDSKKFVRLIDECENVLKWADFHPFEPAASYEQLMEGLKISSAMFLKM